MQYCCEIDIEKYNSRSKHIHTPVLSLLLRCCCGSVDMPANLTKQIPLVAWFTKQNFRECVNKAWLCINGCFLFSIFIFNEFLPSSNYENQILKIKRLLCLITFCSDAFVLPFYTPGFHILATAWPAGWLLPLLTVLATCYCNWASQRSTPSWLCCCQTCLLLFLDFSHP